jgi:hypothetical protein
LFFICFCFILTFLPRRFPYLGHLDIVRYLLENEAIQAVATEQGTFKDFLNSSSPTGFIFLFVFVFG